MTVFEAVALVVTSIVVPYVVALIRNGAITGSKARWLAICVSVIAGLVVGFVGGIPDSIGAMVTLAFASIGGMQVAYTAFKSLGITSKWLDSLADIKTEAK